MDKYRPLQRYLKSIGPGRTSILLTFKQIEAIINAELPFEALRRQTWWANSGGPERLHQRAWIEAGWRVSEVNLQGRSVRFERVSAYV